MFAGWQRRRQARRAPAGPLRDFLDAEPPAGRTELAELPLLAIDLETTGLDAATDHILSIGFVPVDGRRIRLAGAHRLVVRTAREVGQSATIHGLTDDQVAAGLDLEDALTQTLAALRGRVLLAHHAPIETGFLATACAALWGVRPRFGSVDTLAIERARWDRRGEEPPRGALRLPACRERYGLPVVPLHDALSDALACAELYLAATAENERARLKDLS